MKYTQSAYDILEQCHMASSEQKEREISSLPLNAFSNTPVQPPVHIIILQLGASIFRLCPTRAQVFLDLGQILARVCVSFDSKTRVAKWLVTHTMSSNFIFPL